MSVVLDASVAVAAAHPAEAHHAQARRCVDEILAGVHPLVLPTLFEIEVTASLVRRGAPPKGAKAFASSFVELAIEIMTLGPKRASLVADLAAAIRLRAADAVYVWVARKAGATLLTFDNEVLTRAADWCAVKTP